MILTRLFPVSSELQFLSYSKIIMDITHPKDKLYDRSIKGTDQFFHSYHWRIVSFIRLLTLVILILMCSLTTVVAQDQVLQAGASISNITPPLGLPIVGNYKSPLATHIHDQINARTLALDDGTNRIAIVLVDNVSISRSVFDEAKEIVKEAVGLDARNILTAATHTHSSVSARSAHEGEGAEKSEYQRFVAKRIADGIQVAFNNLAPAKIGWGSVDVPQHVFNRRWFLQDSVWSPLGERELVKMNPGYENLDHPAGPIDPEVSFIAVEALDGTPICVLGNYSLHYVGGVPPGEISADYFAVFADRIQELLEADRQSPPFVGILSNGTSGDINNLDFGSGSRQRHPPYEKMKIVAHDVAQSVYAEYKNIDFSTWVPVNGMQSELNLQIRRASPELLARVDKIKAHDPSEGPIYHPLEKIYADRITQLETEWPDDIDIVVQTLRIGDLGIAAIPFETFAETGLEIKEKSPFGSTFTIELANGGYGYLPTPEQHMLGGYETWLTTNKVQKDASVLIVNAIMEQFSSMK